TNIALESQATMYYRAILQNLFFAVLNQTMGKREFRNENQHMNVTNLMRYESYFKDTDKFLKLISNTVPFINGGLFECLDMPNPERKGKKNGGLIIYQDGFSDRKDNKLMVPDYVFFGKEDYVDLSEDYGKKTKAFKEASIKGLINILKSYKFTIAENTPIEEDIALDPELLGRVFENLLASYNPETRSTARKQTGSFYTPREIVNHMVDESLIAHLKNVLIEDYKDEEKLDINLYQLMSFDNIQPFNNDETKDKIINTIDNCKILDPACGSGAFPMGILHKMVHLLGKLDPNNEKWKHRQIKKAELIDNPGIREQLIEDIEEAFNNNELDFGRKLYLIENCIYGVDIQSIAVQISKLRFFISLIVDQKIDKKKKNFGIRPLPNLETKFVAANTLMGIEKPDKQTSLFDNKEVIRLEKEIKRVRHRLFNAKTPKTKRKLREKDENIREMMGNILVESGWANETAKQLAGWNPYDQNSSSPFFDPEWMFDISDGFDVVIGNPPYFVYEGQNKSELNLLRRISIYKPAFIGKLNAYKLFMLKSYKLLTKGGVFSEIFQNSFLADNSAMGIRKHFLKKTQIISIDSFPERDNSKKRVFPGVKMSVCILLSSKNTIDNYTFTLKLWNERQMLSGFISQFNNKEIFQMFPSSYNIPALRKEEKEIFILFYSYPSLNEYFKCYQGELNMSTHREFFTFDSNKYMALKGAQIQKYDVLLSAMSQGDIEYVLIEKYLTAFSTPKSRHHQSRRIVMQGITGVNEKIRLKAAFVDKNFFCAHSCNYFIDSNSSISLWVLLIYLNSTIYNWIFKKTSTNSNVNSYEIENLTIPELNNQYKKIFEQLAQAVSFNKDLVLLGVIDALVFNSFFPDHMKDRKIDIIKYVEKDLKEVTQGREIEPLTDEQKEKIINQLHHKWTESENEIVKRINSFAKKSPDILKPILESK
ncbi:Eco57I restriction-modification methylase domain-containing protein, partial [Thermodesulfobacteriota bacterium]